MSDSYKVLTRKYRPRSFDDVVSQDHVISTLRNAIAQNRISHAYLFCGPRGVGKTTMARVVARMINGVSMDVDGEELGRTLDIIEIDAASNSGVDDVRSLRDGIRVPPQNGTYKVYIIDEVHMLSKSAFNALLKTLEEPPEYVKFIFATTEPHKVLPTVLSRVQRFDFRRIKVSEIVDRLRFICDQEGITIDDASLHVIARKADGALRDALSIMDQAIAFCGNNIEQNVLLDALNVVSNDRLFELIDCAANHDPRRAMEIVDALLFDGHDIQEFLGALTEHLRNMYLAKDAGSMRLVEATDEEKSRLKRASDGFTDQDLLRMMHLASETQYKVRDAHQPRIQLEIAILKLTTMDRSEGLNQLLSEIRDLKKKLHKSGVSGQNGSFSGDENADNASEHSAPSNSDSGAAASAKPASGVPVSPKNASSTPFSGSPAPTKSSAADWNSGSEDTANSDKAPSFQKPLPKKSGEVSGAAMKATSGVPPASTSASHAATSPKTTSGGTNSSGATSSGTTSGKPTSSSNGTPGSLLNSYLSKSAIKKKPVAPTNSGAASLDRPMNTGVQQRTIVNGEADSASTPASRPNDGGSVNTPNSAGNTPSGETANAAKGTGFPGGVHEPHPLDGNGNLDRNGARDSKGNIDRKGSHDAQNVLDGQGSNDPQLTRDVDDRRSKPSHDDAQKAVDTQGSPDAQNALDTQANLDADNAVDSENAVDSGNEYFPDDEPAEDEPLENRTILLHELQEAWPRWLEYVQRDCPKLLSYSVNRTKLIDIREKMVHLECQDELTLQLIKQNERQLTTCFEKVLRTSLYIECSVQKQQASENKNDPYTQFKKLQQADPKVRMIVDMFGAELEY